MKKILLTLFVAAFALSCQKDISSEISTPGIGTPKLQASPLAGAVSGIVVNENNIPVPNAQVTVMNSLYTTDSKGFFSTNTLTLDKYISTVKVNVSGYFTAYRSFSANATRNYVSIKLIPKTLAGTFSSSSTGNVLLANGSSVSFQANGVVIKSSGANYSGTVNVYASYIDPTASDFGARVPGSLMAEDVSNFYVLRSTGMMAVEMESPSGEPLQLATGKPASMKMAIPASLLSQAPATIDTWSLDARGIWIKEGTATKNGTAYDMQVSHFSFWNCDVPTSAIYLSLNLKDQDAHNLSNTWVSLTSSTTFGTSGGMTDSLGNVSGMVPKDESLLLRVFSNLYNCGTPLYTQNIGPYSANASQNIIASLTPAQILNISGTAVNCTGGPVASGVAYIYNGLYMTSTTITNGSFSISIPICTAVSSLNIVVSDNSTSLQGATTAITVTGTTVNAGTLTACGISTDEFINYILDGTSHSITTLNTGAGFYLTSNATATSTNIGAYDQANANYINFIGGGNAAGTFPVLSDSMAVNNLSGIVQAGATVTFTTYGTVGQFVEGSFTIPFGATGSVHTLTGAFRMRRD